MNPILAEVHRGPVLECVHRGAVAVCRPDGSVDLSLGDVQSPMLPRSACKMVQALPLVESGAADQAGLTSRHLALSCASHNGAAIHTDLASAWLAELGLGDDDLRCGPQIPNDEPACTALRASGNQPTQIHNNCSGKHSGMLTLNRHLGSGTEYIDPDHPVQQAVRAATEETARESSTGHATDGCSAPNFAISLTGLATAMAGFARPDEAFSGSRARAAARLRDAMMAHPELVAGEGRACTALMRAASGKAAVKTGAEGVFTAILPEVGLGIAIKIDDGATRGSHAAIAALLSRYGVLDWNDPTVQDFANAPLLNRREIDCGRIQAAKVLLPP
ncbi:MAG: asparaginase [Pseudomonadota bacterium]